MLLNSEEIQEREDAAMASPKEEITLKTPRHPEPPAFEETAWGGRFPDRRYYPFYLANGRDAALINISGSGDGHWERAPYSADVLCKLHAIGWYKADRRLLAKDCGVYGPLMCLGEFTACPRLHNDYVVPRDIRQYFDPKTATLTTFFSQRDDRSDENLELRMQTYMCSNGVLIQEIEVLHAPPCGLSYAFSLGTVSPNHLNHMRPLISPETCEIVSSASGAEILMTSKWPGLKSVAFSLTGGVGIRKTERRSLPGLAYEEIEQIIEPVVTGARFWRAVSFQDDREGGNPPEVSASLLKQLREDGIEPLRERHLLEWQEYFAKSNVELPDPAAQHVYDLSRYLLKANHHPQGYQPVGLLPYQWQGVMFWDATFALEAFLTCGNESEARAIAGQVKRLLPEGRALAARLGNSGARIEWTTNLDAFTTYEPPTRQLHNNAAWARSFCSLGEYLGESPRPDDFAAIEDLLRFLIEEFERHGDTTEQEFAFSGIDESTDDPKLYDTWTFAVLLKALEDYFCLCRKHAIEPAFPSSLLQRIEEILAGNVDGDGVLQSFRGGRLPHWGSLIFDLFPNHPAALPTISRMAENYDPARDLFNFHGLNRYAEKTFPWATNLVVRCLAKIGRQEALDFLLHNLNHVNYFGGFSERIYYHGEHYINWFSTAHASLVLAMNTLLATEVDGHVQLLGGLDLKRWHTLSFAGLHAGDGWVVTLEMKNGRVKKCVVQNLRSEARLLNLTIPVLSITHTQTAEPGANTIALPQSLFMNGGE